MICKRRFIVFYILLVPNQIIMILKQVKQQRTNNLSLLRFIKIRMMLTNVMLEDMNTFTITADNVIEILKEVTDNTLREKIIQLAASKTSSSTSIPSDKKVKDEFNYSAPYSLSEVHNRLSSKQITIILKNQLYPPIILGTPFINAIYPFTNINAKGFSATYKNQDISYTFITEPISRDINSIIEMKQKHVDYLQLEIFSMNIFDTLKSAKVQEKMIKAKCYVCRMDPPLVTKARGRGSYTCGRGRSSSSKTSGSSYGSSSNSPIIQRGGMSLVKLASSSKEATSSIHLDDILENNPLYAQLRAYLSQKQNDTFASVAKEEVDDIRSYERVVKKEMIFLIENSETQRKEEPWKIFQ
ncbi:hypothetical protein H5410_040729 [Solanum commersonii]|uniref:Uncharacterized protein n=1 Tax=Solanum commersonii TaxID=4109 RepID=A0A9J5XRQ2_SOLCO|nr:hypothetical protein H5410_040729 [Solanum commersonii]